MMSLCLLTYHKFIEIFLLFLFHNAKCKENNPGDQVQYLLAHMV